MLIVNFLSQSLTLVHLEVYTSQRLPSKSGLSEKFIFAFGTLQNDIGQLFVHFIQEHLKESCLFVEGTCPNDGCGANLLKREFGQHMTRNCMFKKERLPIMEVFFLIIVFFCLYPNVPENYDNMTHPISPSLQYYEVSFEILH